LEGEKFLPFVKPFIYHRGLCPKAPQHFWGGVTGKFSLDKWPDKVEKILEYADLP
jgi:hypothetical protein